MRQPFCTSAGPSLTGQAHAAVPIKTIGDDGGSALVKRPRLVLSVAAGPPVIAREAPPPAAYLRANLGSDCQVNKFRRLRRLREQRIDFGDLLFGEIAILNRLGIDEYI